MIDFDPQCNLSIATIGYEELSEYFDKTEDFPFGQTIRAFAQASLQPGQISKTYLTNPKYQKSTLHSKGLTVHNQYQPKPHQLLIKQAQTHDYNS